MSDQENIVRNEIRTHFGLRPDMKFFSNPVGNGWVSVKPKEMKGGMFLPYPRRVSFGLFKGSSDFIGWLTIDGKAIFMALEVKDDIGKPSPEQLNFIAQVKAAGGIAGVVRSVQDVENLIQSYKQEKGYAA